MSKEKRAIRVVVACRGSAGQPALPIYTTHVTDAEYNLGMHYDFAGHMAQNAGFEGPFIYFDETEQHAIHAASAALGAPGKMPKVVVQMDGGLVHQVISNCNMEVMVADYDLEGADEKTLAECDKIPSIEDLTVTKLAACRLEMPLVNPELVAQMMGGDESAADGEAREQVVTFTVFVQQGDGRGTVNITSYQAESAEDAAARAIEQVAEDWGDSSGPSGFQPFDKANLRVLGIAKGDVEIVEWNDLDQ